MRIAKVVGLGAADDELFQYVVLDEVSGDRQLAIEIGQAQRRAEPRGAGAGTDLRRSRGAARDGGQMRG
jgi:hypothetical protein